MQTKTEPSTRVLRRQTAEEGSTTKREPREVRGEQTSITEQHVPRRAPSGKTTLQGPCCCCHNAGGTGRVP